MAQRPQEDRMSGALMGDGPAWLRSADDELASGEKPI